MTMGGIAAAIGLVIDDAIVVVEAIFAEDRERPAARRGDSERRSARSSTRLVGSTLTPVVVFIPLAFLDGITGVFFRALALTMVVALLTSLRAGRDTDAVAGRVVHARPRPPGARSRAEERGGRFSASHASFGIYEVAVRAALRHSWLTLGGVRRSARARRARLSEPGKRISPADGRRRLRHRLRRAVRHQPVRDQPPTAAGRGDPARDARTSRAIHAARARASRSPSPSRTPAIFS